MTSEPENHTLAYLRRLDGKLDRVLSEIGELKLRQNEAHRAVLALRREQAADAESVAHVQARLDQFDGRLDRIERRLDLREDPLA